MSRIEDNADGWEWWAGSDEENMTIGPCDTREAAIGEATDDRSGEFEAEDGTWKLSVHVVEARQDPLLVSDWAFHYFISNADERLSESSRVAAENDEGPWFVCSPEQEENLVAKLKKVCDQWQQENTLEFISYTFSATRNESHVVIDLPSNTGDE